MSRTRNKLNDVRVKSSFYVFDGHVGKASFLKKQEGKVNMRARAKIAWRAEARLTVNDRLRGRLRLSVLNLPGLSHEKRGTDGSP